MKTIPSFPPEIEETFWGRVHKTDSCWLWIAGKDDLGYGLFTFHASQYYAHRIAWKLVRGKDPVGWILCHNCPGGDNPSCVNPDHLYLGTHQSNARDRTRNGTQARLSGEQNPFAVLTGDKALTIRTRYMDHPCPETVIALAGELAVSTNTIHHVLKCHTWTEPQYLPDGFIPVITRGPARTFCKYGHPATPENLYPNRMCRLCAQASREQKRQRR